ncbi:DUF2232 domain-containing protein [Prochlorococcus marinus]|uniref:DUF2232 domain-containing protein n=1 Tax=Prochlorococcus marinus str. PAC1 TaxID=59924 RepID=A0A0A2BYT7_PROMR|nr:DUF2232 domain-containing protein [Prochlorococcus marinus]KGG19256.1 hypothetical protein EV03_1636 [Prochlorococcus marinus str. PAC1]
MNSDNKNSLKSRSLYKAPLSKRQALKIVESSYLAAATALIWIALYYLPIGGAVFRLALPLPLALLQIRRGVKTGIEGVTICVMLLTALMGPLRGPLVLFPYGLLSLWLGYCWEKGWNWWLSWSVGVSIGTMGFLVRVFVLSLLVGENLWVILTRAGAGLLEKGIDIFNLSFTPDMRQVQIVALCLIITQEIIYVLCLHALAYWIFPRLKSSIPEPPALLEKLISLESN